jgi:hypothetical protein
VPQNPTGKQLLHAAFGLFRQDPQMVWLPVLGALAGFVGFALVATPIVVGLGVNVAGVLAALLEGRTPTVGGSLAKAWTRKGTILEWAVLASIVSLVIRLIEQRAGLLARLVGLAGALSWAIATFFVLPVLAFEDVGPITAVKRSTAVLRSRWPNVARGSLRFGVLFLGWSLAAMAVLFVGVAMLHSTPYLGVPVIAVGALALLAVAMFAGTAGIYVRTILYRYATNQSVPSLGVNLDAAVNAPIPSRSLLG